MRSISSEESDDNEAGDDGGGRDVVVGLNGIDATPALEDRRNYRRRRETAGEERQINTREEQFRRRAKADDAQIRLTSLSAYVSTLGGGAFLCHYLSVAMRLTRRQPCLAVLRGNRDTASRCRINAGYCFIRNGKADRRKRVIRLVLGDVLGLLEPEY